MDKIAVVVVETYSAKLVIANVVQDSFFSICDVEVEPIKFGLEMDDDHFLKKNQIMSIISTLKNFRKICDMYGVSKTIAIASFVKDTKPMNIYSFFDEVFVTCGFRFTLLSPEEQNNAIYTGIMNSYDIPKAIVVNVGADNIHLIQYNRRNILNQAYIPVGPKTLIEMYSLSKLDKEEEGHSSVRVLKNIIFLVLQEAREERSQAGIHIRRTLQQATVGTQTTRNNQECWDGHVHAPVHV